MEAEAREDACNDYQSSLEDLTFNSKPHINMLTILAEENLLFARDVVALIEAQIAKAPTAEKLPVMYLMDSIVKNVGREYLDAFSKNLVSTFVNVFEKVEENTRKSLFKLRSTWDEIFPSKKLYALDVRVNSIDPAWPIKPLPPNVNTSSIHVNPKFLNKTPEEPSTPAPIIPVAAPVIPASLNSPDIPKNLTQEQIIRQQLLAKQKQLLELQQKKLELELEQTKAQLAVSLSAQQGISTIGSVSTPSKQNPSSQTVLHVIGKASHASSKTPHVPTKTTAHTPTRVPPGTTKVVQSVTVHPEKNKPLPPAQPPEEKGPARDPRINRLSPHASHPKDHGHKKELATSTNQAENKISKSVPNEKGMPLKQEKTKVEKVPKKEALSNESKSKSLSPLKSKLPHAKDSKIHECEGTKVAEDGKRDPRLRKYMPFAKEEDKERRKSTDKKEERSKSSECRAIGGGRTKVNGIVQKRDTSMEDLEKSGKLRSSSRKRTRSRSPKSRSPISHSPKRRDRRSPKRRPRSISPPLSKTGKLRHSGQKPFHLDEFSSKIREDRSSGKRSLKPDLRDSRRVKKSQERQETHQHSLARPTSEPNENVENWHGSKPSKRWKSGWEESKTSQSDDHLALVKPPHLRRRDSWQSDKGILSPRTPKQQHRLSVDANLQIPKELTSASKGDLLKKANERLASGEITQDEFLVVAHKIRQLFQYQEEKHRYSDWDSPTEEKGAFKKEHLSNAESAYYKHMAQLKRTQVHPPRPDAMQCDIFDHNREDNVVLGRESEQSKHGGRFIVGPLDRKEQFDERSRRHSPASSIRPFRDDRSPAGSKHRVDDEGDLNKGLMSSKNYDLKVPYEAWSDEFRNSARLQGRSVQDFSTPERKGDQFRDYTHEERLNLGQVESREEKKLAFDDAFSAKRLGFESSDKGAYIGSPSSVFGSRDVDDPLEELMEVGHRMVGSPLPSVSRVEELGNADFENISEHRSSDSDDDPLAQMSVRFDGELIEPEECAKKRSLSIQRFSNALLHPVGTHKLDLLSGQPKLFDSTLGPLLGTPNQLECPKRFESLTGQTLHSQRFEGMPSQQLGPKRLEGGPAHPMGVQRFEGGSSASQQRFEGAVIKPIGQQRFEGLLGQPVGPQRFEGAPGQPVGPQRFEGAPGQPVGPQRFEGAPGQAVGPQRFEGAPGQAVGPQRFEGAPGQPVGPQRFEGAPGQPVGPQRFEGAPGQPVGPQRFEGAPGQPGGPQRFEGAPGQPGVPQRFEGAPGQPVGPQRFEGAPGQTVGPQRFEGAPGQPGGPQRFEGAPGQPSGPQRFEAAPRQPIGPPRFEGMHGQPVGPPRFGGPAGQPVGPPRFQGIQAPSVGPSRFEGPPGQPAAPQRFDGPLGQSGPPPRFEGQPAQPGAPHRFDGPLGQSPALPRFERPPGPLQRFEGPLGQPGAPQRFEQPPGQPGAPQRFDGPLVQPGAPQRFEGPLGQPGAQQRFERGPCVSVGPPRFEGIPGQTGLPRFEGPGQPPRFEGLPGQQVGGMRFEGPPGAIRFERPSGQPGATLRLDGPTGPRFDVHQPLRFDSGPSMQVIPRFDGPPGHPGPRFEGTNIHRFEGPPTQPRFDGLHGQLPQRFERPPVQQTPPRFDGPMGQQTPPRFDTPVPQRSDGVPQPPLNRFVPQGPRFDGNSAPRLDAPLYGQPASYSGPPHSFNGPFQRFDLPQAPNFHGPPPGSGTQPFPNRPPPPGPYFGVPTSMPLGNLPPPPQPVPVLAGMTQPAHFNPGQPFMPNETQNQGNYNKSQPGPVPFPRSENHLGQLDVNELFSKLLSTGILTTAQTDAAATQLTETAKQPNIEEMEMEEEEDDDQAEDPSIPDLTNFTIEDLRQRYDSVINRLYTGIQCYSCGMRFTASQTDVYADHLDWHYRQNRSEKDVSRKVTHRRWYYGLTDWIEFEEIADLEERAKSLFFEKVHEEVILKTQEAVREKEFQSVPAGRSAVVESCAICQEQFEQYWDEEEEEWHLKNAMRVEEQIYHPSCYEDYQNTSSFLDYTPSPSKMHMENPLNAMLNIVNKELLDPVSRSTVACSTIKEEPQDSSLSYGENVPIPPSVEKILIPPKVEKAILPVPPSIEKVPVPPGVEKVPVPPRVEKVPVPPRVEKVPVPPRVEKVPVPPRVEKVPVPPSVEKVPVPPSIEKDPVPPSVDQVPVPPSGDQVPVPPSVDQVPVSPSVEKVPVPPSVEKVPVPHSVEKVPVPHSVEKVPVPHSVEKVPVPFSVEKVPVAPSVETTPVALSVETTLVALSVETTPVALSVETTPVAPSVETVPVAPSVETVPVAPSVETVPVAPSVEMVPVAPSVETVPVAPSVETVPVAPSVETVPVAPSVETVPVAPSVETVPVAPSVETVTVAPSVETVPVAPSVETVPVAPSVETVPVPAPSVETVPVPAPSVETVPVPAPSVEMVPVPPSVEMVPVPPSVEMVPVPPSVEMVPVPPSVEMVPVPPSVEMVPVPPSVEMVPVPPSVEMVPVPPSVEMVPVPPSSVEKASASAVEKAPASNTVENVPASSAVEKVPAPAVERVPGLFSVEETPAPFAVETAPAPFAVETSPAPFAVETAPAPFAVETASTLASVEKIPAPSAAEKAFSLFSSEKTRSPWPADDKMVWSPPCVQKTAAPAGTGDTPLTLAGETTSACEMEAQEALSTCKTETLSSCEMEITSACKMETISFGEMEALRTFKMETTSDCKMETISFGDMEALRTFKMETTSDCKMETSPVCTNDTPIACTSDTHTACTQESKSMLLEIKTEPVESP